MDQETTKFIAGIVSGYIELFAILLLAISIFFIIINNLIYFIKRNEVTYKNWKGRSWKAIQGGLDLFVVSDLLSTITIDRTLQSVITLGILLIIRTFVSWSLEMEAEGCWPWQKKALAFKEKSL